MFHYNTGCLLKTRVYNFVSLPSRSIRFASVLQDQTKPEELTKAKLFDVKINVNDYPLARRDDTVVDVLHGVKVADPYRWLENPDSVETQDFVDKLNKISKPFLNGSNARAELKDRLTKLWDYEKFGCQAKHGDYYYYEHNTGLQNQNVIYRQKNLKDPGEVFLDPNSWSNDGTTAIRQTAWSLDGSLMAISVSNKGSDWETIKFLKNSGEHLKDEIKGVKYSVISWLKNDGVFYSKYDGFKEEKDGISVEKDEYHSLYYHKLGTDCHDDVLVAEFRDKPGNMVFGGVTEDSKFLIIRVQDGCDPTNQLYLVDLESINHKITQKPDLIPLFTKCDSKYNYVHNDGNSFVFETDKDAPMSKLIRLDLADLHKGEDAWQTVLEHDEKRKLVGVAPIAKDKLLVGYLENACDAIYIHDLKSGRQLEKLPLSLGSITAFSGKISDDEVFFSYESYLEPSVTYRLDFSKPKNASGKLDLHVVHKTNVPGLDPSEFTSKQVFYSSKDGTKVPLCILHPNNMNLDGQNPVLLGGYGGFGIAVKPHFSVAQLLFMKMFGAAIAVANIRGGGEYGERWHQAGMKEKKQNVFDDFIAAAEYLIKEKYTNKEKLAIQGGSNGGLLMGVVSQQRPDLFGAVVNQVGLLDMLRFHKFSIGGAWIPEYGNPDDPKDFKYLYKYSPLHNIRLPKGQQWPSTMIMTADHDDRAVPAHSLKYIAQLYYELQDHKEVQTNPVLARVDVSSGHGALKPTGKVIDEVVDVFSFLQRTLNMEKRA